VKLVYHPEFEAELMAAAGFYERKVRGLGVRFLDEFERSVATIMLAPERWRIIHGD
jgi:hypothetical protein